MVSFFDWSQPTSCTSVLQQFELSSFKNVDFFFFFKDGDSLCHWCNCLWSLAGGLSERLGDLKMNFWLE